MPSGNNVTYSNGAFATTLQYKEQILQAAQATGLSPEVIFGALVEENHDYHSDLLTKLGDVNVVARMLNGLDHNALLTQYNQAASAGKLDNHTWSDKIFNVMLNDVGPFNIQVGTAYRTILDYSIRTPASQDALNLLQYVNDLPKLVADLMNGAAAPAVASQVLLGMKNYIDNVADPVYWSEQSAVQRLEEIAQDNYVANGNKYEPRPGETTAAGVNHEYNATTIGILFDHDDYETPPAPTPSRLVRNPAPCSGREF
jgi:hypothetical protein